MSSLNTIGTSLKHAAQWLPILMFLPVLFLMEELLRLNPKFHLWTTVGQVFTRAGRFINSFFLRKEHPHE